MCVCVCVECASGTHLAFFSVKHEIGPVRIGLHEAKVEQFVKAQRQDLLADPVARLLVQLHALFNRNPFQELGAEHLAGAQFV